MALPASFAADGFQQPKNRYRRIMIGTEGGANTGKSEFILSGPPPGIVLSLSRDHEAMLENPNPPETRGADFLWHPVRLPLVQAQQATYQDLWKNYRDFYNKMLANADARTVAVDSDTDAFDLQLLAEFGRLDKIMPRTRGPLNAAKKLLIAKAFESGKVCIFTHKLKKQYEDLIDPSTGKQLIDDQGEVKREWFGKYQRAGFGEYEYLFQIQLRHLYKPATWNARLQRNIPHQWGIQILMCKSNRELEGEQLWGSDCNLPSLLQLVYPHIPLTEWGYK